MKDFKIDSEGPRHIHECEECKPQHTPTPWIIRPAEVDENKFQIRHETERNDGMWWASVVAMTSDQICEEHGGTPEANAAYIVRAVNTHEELVKALKAVAISLIDDEHYQEFKPLLKTVEDALAKAEGEEQP